MDYISERDLAYLKNKYHGPEYNPVKNNRFILHDEPFDPATGLSGAELCALVLDYDKTIRHLPRSMRKAHAFRLVMENTRINCDPRDYFPAIHSMDRKPIGQLTGMWRQEIFAEHLPGVAEETGKMGRYGVATIWPDYDHNVPLWDALFAGGFVGVRENVLRARDELAAKTGLSERQSAFYESILITYDAILHLIGRMRDHAAAQAETASPADAARTEKLIAALDSLRVGAPKTLYEVLLLIYLYFITSEHVETLQVRSLCNMDRQLAPFYFADLAAGIPEEEERTVLAYFLYQFAAIDNYWGQPMYLGGTNPDGTTVVNPFSHVILDVYDRLGIMNPKIQIKFSAATPKDFALRALDMIRRGHSSIVFVCEDTIMKSLRLKGFSEEEAHRCDISGCYETKPQGSLGTGMNYMNLLKPLELVMHRGRDGITGVQLFPDSGEDFPTVESLWDAYIHMLKIIIDRTIALVNAFEEYSAEVNPQPMLAGTFPTCLAAGRDPFEGSCRSNTCTMMFGFLANAADSFAMIQKYVYDEKLLTLRELTEILDKNWEGAEILRRRILADPDHYGNNRELPDGYAVKLTRFLSEYVNGRPNAKIRGGKWYVGLHVARQSYDQGIKTLASPDGRKTGDELSKNASASMGMNREGATAAVLSVTKLDAVSLPSDCPLDMGLLPSAVSGEDGLEAMYGLLSAFDRMGGHAMHFNVFNGEILREAQKHPEKYADLQIRVCGWNVLFANMAKVEQDGFIKQAEALI